MSFSVVTSNWFRLTLPLLLLAFVYLGLDSIIDFTKSNLGILSNLPFVLFFCCLALSYAFKQNHIAMVSCAMLTAYWFIQERLQSPLSTGTTILELSLLAALLPVTLVLVFVFKRNSTFIKSLVLYLMTLGCIVMWCYLILTHFYDGGFENINDTFLFVVPTVSKLPLILVLYSSTMVLVFAMFVMSLNRISDVVIYSACLLSSVTFIFFHIPHISSMMFSLSGVLMLTYLLSASHELAFKDQLTNIPGRLALESDLRHLGRRYTIAMIDIDHFKSFNDTYGHDTGDDVLRLVASQMERVGGGARIYRYGGEEFTVLFKGKTAEQAKVHLENLRASVEAYDLVLRDVDNRPKDEKAGAKKRSGQRKGEVTNITISIGVCDSAKAKGVYQVMKSADVALYLAKQKGRNQVCFT